MTKKTIGEKAEQNSNAFLNEALSKIPAPPKGKGPKECTECYAEIPEQRRIVCGNGLCIVCAERNERNRNLYAK